MSIMWSCSDDKMLSFLIFFCTIDTGGASKDFEQGCDICCTEIMEGKKILQYLFLKQSSIMDLGCQLRLRSCDGKS